MSVDEKTFEHFCKLRQDYYVAARSNIVNQLYNMAGINFGYCIELSLKFILRNNGHRNELLKGHKLKSYINDVVNRKYISKIRISDDFIEFANQNLNTRYPMHIIDRDNKNKSANKPHFFSIDHLHCYDDFILQLDDEILKITENPTASIGLECAKQINSSLGRIFFHCNDHAFERIPKYLQLLKDMPEHQNSYLELKHAATNEPALWNFTGLMAYRPWGPKKNWNPAYDYEAPNLTESKGKLRSALWKTNTKENSMYLSSGEFIFPKDGNVEISTIEIINNKN